MVEIDAIAEIPMPMLDFYFQRDLQAFRDVAKQVLNLDRYEEITRYPSDSGGLIIETCTVPNIPLPSAVSSFFALDKIVLTDVVEYPTVRPPAGQPYRLGYSLRPPIYQDSLDMTATMVFTETGPDSCTLHLKGTLDVNIWGWGSMIGSIVSGAVADGYSKIPLAVKTWTRRRNWLRLFHQLSQPDIDNAADDGCSTTLGKLEEGAAAELTVCDTDLEDRSSHDSAATVFLDEPDTTSSASAHSTLHSRASKSVSDEVSIDVGVPSTKDVKKRERSSSQIFIAFVAVLMLMLMVGVLSQRQQVSTV